MTSRFVVAATLGLLWMVSCASQVFAQDAVEQPASVLALSVGPGVVDRDALRRSLEAELGVAVEDAGNAPAYMPTLSVIALPNGNTEVALSSRTVPRSTREFLLSAQLPEERVEMVTLIAANLIRNEAAALLPELKPAPAAIEPPPETVEPPKVELMGPCAPRPPREFGIDLAPGVGASSQERGRTATRAFSLSVFGSLYDRLQGFDLTWIGVSIVRKSVCGGQSGLANVSWGPAIGAQGGMLNLTKGFLRGGQAGLINATLGELTGAQAGLVNIAHGDLIGGQAGLTNYAGNELTGAQHGLLNVALRDSIGMQAGLANYVGGHLIGAQLGTANVAHGDVEGVQLGVANIATGEVKGVQVGVFNYADRAAASIGLLSIVRHGRTSIDVSGTVDSSLVLATVTHGGKYVHNILGIGARANPGDGRLATVYGIGVRALSNRWLRLDLDVLSHNVYPSSDLKHRGVSMITSVRVPVTVMITHGFGVMGAVSYNFGITDKDETREVNNFGSTSLRRGSENVRGWPGLTLGLRYEFDHGV